MVGLVGQGRVSAEPLRTSSLQAILASPDLGTVGCKPIGDVVEFW